MVDELTSFESAVPFSLGSKVGEGRQGTVYKAYESTHQRSVALKLLQCHEASCSELLDAALAASSLHHPNIATVHHAARVNGQTYIATEWVEGQQLSNYLVDKRHALLERLDIAWQIASAMACAHQAGVLHRALKPSNVLLTNERQVKLVDFGLASQELQAAVSSLTDGADAPELTGSTRFQTNAWLAPELLQQQKASTASDIFSFGVLLYELCYQQHPFAAVDAIATAAAITEGMLQPIPELVKRQVPKAVQQLIRDCLLPEPAQRPQSMLQIANKLAQSKRQLSRQQQPNLIGWLSRRPLLSTGFIVVCLLFGVGYWILHEELPSTGTQTLVLMPFEVLSDDPDIQQLGRGLGLSLNHDLVLLGQNNNGVWVIPPVELRRYQDATIQQLQQHFAADRILAGSLHHSSSNLRFTLLLLDGQDGHLLQRSELELPLTDWLHSQHKIRQAVLAMLQWSLPSSQAMQDVQEEAYRHYLTGLSHLYRRDYIQHLASGIAALEHALMLQPDFLEAELALSRAGLWKARQRDALHWPARVQAILDTLKQRHTEDSRLQVLSGQLAVLQSRYDDAIEYFEQVLLVEPNHIEAYLGLAEAYRLHGQPELAEQTYQSALQQNHSWFVLHYLATFYLQTGQLDNAELAYRKLSEWTPGNATVWQMLGAIQFNRAQYSEALYAFNQALELSPIASNYSNSATALFYQRRYDEAVQAFQQAVELDGQNYLLWANLADSYRHNQQDHFAKEAYTKAIALLSERLELAPHNTLLRLRFAVYHAKSGQCTIAEATMQALPELTESRQQVLAAQQAMACGFRDRAKDWLHQALDSGYLLQSILDEPEFQGLELEPR